jgi:hypothetical protein
MTLHLGNVPANSTLYIPFASYGKTNGESITLTGLAVTDIEIYKNGSVTQRASDAGYTLLDTDGIDFDGLTGIHGFSIDLSDNTDASFYAVGSFYWVVVSSVTIDSQTVNFIAATFRIVAAEAIAGKPKVDVDAWLGTAAATPSVAGVPEVDLTHVAGATTNVAALATNVDAILTDTADMQPKLGTPAGASVSADIAAVKVDTAAILVDTGTTLDGKIDAIDNFIDTEIADIQARLPAALTAGGNMKSDALAISGSTAAADTLELSTEAICTGTCDTGGSTTSIVASALSPASAVNDQFNGRIMIFNSDTTTAALRNQATDITDFVHATQTFTVTALTTAPASGDTFIIV